MASSQCRTSGDQIFSLCFRRFPGGCAIAPSVALGRLTSLTRLDFSTKNRMCIYFSELTHDQQVTLNAILADTPRLDLSWIQVLDLLRALTDSVNSSAGSVRVAVTCQGNPRIGVFTCLDQQGCVSGPMIEYLRDFLSGLGVKPQ